MSNHPNRSSISKIAIAHGVRLARRHRGYSLHGFLSDCESAARAINEARADRNLPSFFIERADTGFYLQA